MITVGSLFSGYGGVEIGLERTGFFKTVWHCEIGNDDSAPNHHQQEYQRRKVCKTLHPDSYPLGKTIDKHGDAQMRSVFNRQDGPQECQPDQQEPWQLFRPINGLMEDIAENDLDKNCA